MDLKHLLARITSLALVFSGFYQILLSLRATFYLYPQMNLNSPESPILEQGLIEKAILLYFSMIISSSIGIYLLFTPRGKIKIIHILSGIIIFLASAFFMVKTPLTTDPVIDLIKNFLFVKN